MEFDFMTMQEAEDRHAAEQGQALKDYMKAKREKKEARQAEINRLCAKVVEQENENRRQEMERKIKEETATVTEAIRAKYEREASAEWNESDEEKARRKWVRSIRGESTP